MDEQESSQPADEQPGELEQPQTPTETVTSTPGKPGGHGAAEAPSFAPVSGL